MLFQAALLYKGVPFCGGTIIDERHILTAGNCCKPNLKLLVKPSEVAVAVGNLNLYDTSNVKRVQNVFIHESYDPVTLANNIAVLRVIDRLILLYIHKRYQWHRFQVLSTSGQMTYDPSI